MAQLSGELAAYGYNAEESTAADVANGLWYLAEGNFVDAGMSFLSAIPGVGDAFGAGKTALKARSAMADTAKSAQSAISNLANGLAREVWEKANSKTLRKNMTAAGKEEPDYRNAAHHIVAGGAKDADPARKRLESLGVGINNEANGVFLPTQRGAFEAAYHPSLHTKAYYKEVNDRLKDVEDRDEAMEVLRKIEKELLAGTFPR